MEGVVKAAGVFVLAALAGALASAAMAQTTRPSDGQIDSILRRLLPRDDWSLQ